MVRLDRPDVAYVDADGKFFTSPAVGRRAAINTPGGGASDGTRVPDLIAGVEPYLRRELELLNPATFAIPAPGSFGNLRRGQLRGPGSFEVDFALTRVLINKEEICNDNKVSGELKIEVFQTRSEHVS